MRVKKDRDKRRDKKRRQLRGGKNEKRKES